MHERWMRFLKKLKIKLIQFGQAPVMIAAVVTNVAAVVVVVAVACIQIEPSLTISGKHQLLPHLTAAPDTWHCSLTFSAFVVAVAVAVAVGRTLELKKNV